MRNTAGWSVEVTVQRGTQTLWVYNAKKEVVATATPNLGGGYGFSYHRADMWDLNIAQLRPLFDEALRRAGKGATKW